MRETALEAQSGLNGVSGGVPTGAFPAGGHEPLPEAVAALVTDKGHGLPAASIPPSVLSPEANAAQQPSVSRPESDVGACLDTSAGGCARLVEGRGTGKGGRKGRG